LKPDDIPEWAVFFESDDASRFLPDYGMELPEAKAWDWINRQRNRYANRRYGLLALTDKANGRFMGQSGLIHHKIEGIDELMLGYFLLPEFRARGYATEAARFFIHQAFSRGLSESVAAFIHIDNHASQQVAVRLGMQRERQTVFKGLDVFMYRVGAGKEEL
jgi:RimJ/RimL family protein N-acetyltransferase